VVVEPNKQPIENEAFDILVYNLVGVTTPCTMKMNSYIKTHNVVVLIYSCSIHNYVDIKVTKKVDYVVNTSKFF